MEELKRTIKKTVAHTQVNPPSDAMSEFIKRCTYTITATKRYRSAMSAARQNMLHFVRKKLQNAVDY